MLLATSSEPNRELLLTKPAKRLPRGRIPAFGEEGGALKRWRFVGRGQLDERRRFSIDASSTGERAPVGRWRSHLAGTTCRGATRSGATLRSSTFSPTAPTHTPRSSRWCRHSPMRHRRNRPFYASKAGYSGHRADRGDAPRSARRTRTRCVGLAGDNNRKKEGGSHRRHVANSEWGSASSRNESRSASQSHPAPDVSSGSSV